MIEIKCVAPGLVATNTLRAGTPESPWFIFMLGIAEPSTFFFPVTRSLENAVPAAGEPSFDTADALHNYVPEVC